MKKLSILFILFVLALSASADRSVIRRAEASPATMIIAGGGTPADASCETSGESCSGGSTSVINLADLSAYNWAASGRAELGVGDGVTVCRIDIYMWANNSPTQGLKAAIYSDAGDNTPGSLVGTASSEVDGSGISTSPGFVTFSDVSATLSESTNYFVVVYVSTGSADGTNNFYLGRSGLSACGLTSTFNDADGEGSWNEYSGVRAFGFTLYSE